eukprot:TRINITY_DN6779_c0_g1_i3.p1 TRINITY_DN6779_c0_g1~~TRINITY_DN6779_c0_g1_i3.p1  ORF type:complete len:280 (-),score=56.82 TRINITY_DN6779_c0_g1_i3:115-954(-)
MLSEFKHPNVINLVGYFENSTNIYLVLPYASSGDLHSSITRLGSLSLASTRIVIAQIVNGLEYLHSLGILYGDLKPENVLVMGNGTISLTDFGSSRYIKDIKDGDRVEGTKEYLSPEAASGKPVLESDLWSLGCVVFQVLTGNLPPWLEEEDLDENRVVTFAGDEERRQKRFPTSFPSVATELVEKLLHLDPYKRLGSEKNGGYSLLKQDIFFEGIDWETVHSSSQGILEAGTSAPQKSQSWGRRKCSIMWAPSPEALSFTEDESKLDVIEEEEEHVAV